MNGKYTKSTLLLAMLIAVVMGVLLFSACGSAAATKKDKSKSKRSKAVAENQNSGSETPAEHPAEAANANTAVSAEEDGQGEHPKGTTVKKDAKKDDKRHAKAPEKGRSPDVIWSNLVKGNKRFMAGRHTGVNYSAARQKLAKGQHPEVIVLGCADSRVPPEFVFDKNLGDLFVVRDAGNIGDKVSIGSIEYAVEHLNSKVLVILGHESCGAVAAAVSGQEMPSDNLRAIVETISPAFEGSTTCIIGKESNLSCIELNVRQSASDILLKSPILKKAVDEKELMIVHAVYKMETGEVVRLD